MINKSTLFFFTISLLLISTHIYALSTSSYLISNIAFKSHDFKNVFKELQIEKEDLNLNDYENKLIALVNLNNAMSGRPHRP